jgi:hypothetical protein
MLPGMRGEAACRVAVCVCALVYFRGKVPFLGVLTGSRL